MSRILHFYILLRPDCFVCKFSLEARAILMIFHDESALAFGHVFGERKYHYYCLIKFIILIIEDIN